MAEAALVIAILVPNQNTGLFGVGDEEPAIRVKGNGMGQGQVIIGNRIGCLIDLFYVQRL